MNCVKIMKMQSKKSNLLFDFNSSFKFKDEVNYSNLTIYLLCNHTMPNAILADTQGLQYLSEFHKISYFGIQMDNVYFLITLSFNFWFLGG